mmetsp:Transcript_14556/g.61466  ORF Transcript_14556/g.61466 Transcript_14556/m.61466 type:complete len:235 (-) Transcript_14556:392-1096(-)
MCRLYAPDPHARNQNLSPPHSGATHARKPSSSSFLSRFLPMNMNRLSRVSPSFQPATFPAAELAISIVMCTPWNTTRSSDPATRRIPLLRNMSSPFVRNSRVSHPFSSAIAIAPGTRIPTEVTLSSCRCSPSTLRNSSSKSHATARSKARIPSTSPTSTRASTHSMTAALEFMPRILLTSAVFSSGVTRSTLFRRILSAKATCSTDSFSTPSGLTSSRCDPRCLASATVRMASR